MGGFCLVVDAPYVLYTTKIRLSITYGVFIRGMSNYSYRVELAGGESVINGATLCSLNINIK